jgi:hypothetical protein
MGDEEARLHRAVRKNLHGAVALREAYTKKEDEIIEPLAAAAGWKKVHPGDAAESAGSVAQRAVSSGSTSAAPSAKGKFPTGKAALGLLGAAGVAAGGYALHKHLKNKQEEKQAAAVPSFGKMLSGYANKNPITTAMTVGGAAVGALKGSGQYDANGREIPRGLGSRLMGGAMGAAGGLAVGTAGSIAGRAHDMSQMTRHAGKSPLELLRRGAGDQLKQTATQFGYGKHQGVNNAVGWLKAPPTAAPVAAAVPTPPAA